MAAATNRATRRYTRADWNDFAHVGPGTLAGRYLRLFWHPVYRAQDLPAGRAIPIRILGEDFTLYRGETPLPLGEGGGEGGKPHLLAFRCAHRGTQLSTGWVEGDNLRCFYHGWKYGPDGQCVEQPAEPEPFCQKVRIRSYPTEAYLGIIFCYFGEGDPPPLPRYPDFEDFDGVRLVYAGDIWPCNYFNRIDNAPDIVHPSFAHRQIGLPIPRVEAEETEFGVEAKGFFPNGWVYVAKFNMPTMNEIEGVPEGPDETRWRRHLAWRIPVDDTHYKSIHVELVYVEGEAKERFLEWERTREPEPSEAEVGEAVLAGRLGMEDVDAPSNFIVNMQDYVAQVAQGAIPDRSQDHLGREDVGIILVRQIWARELRALAQGRPLTQWRRSVPTDGAERT